MDITQHTKELFGEMVKKIVDEYQADLAAVTIMRGTKLTFDELKEKTFELDKTLRGKGVKLIETYKKETGQDAEELIGDFKTIITAALQQFIKTL